MDFHTIVEEVIQEFKLSPIDMLGIGDASGEYIYLKNLKDTYVRTVRDVVTILADGNGRSGRSVLEIGSFLGAVSISLRRLGFKVCALDIPEFYKSSTLRALYEKNGIRFNGLNLRTSTLPYDSNCFDAVVICEVMEHLNFNPLPVLQEINRVLKDDGYIYIGMPNQCSLENRFKLLLGKSIHNPIEDFFKQLDRNDNMIVGLHWREYTLGETIELIEKMGFDVVKKYYFVPAEQYGPNFLKRMLKEIVFSYASFRPFYVAIGKKISVPIYDFWLTEANS